jgi:uncharacterized protein YcfL
MKKFFLLIVFIFLVSCKSSNKITYVNDPTKVEMNRYYLIKDRTKQENYQRSFYYNTRQYSIYSTGKKYNSLK